MKTIYSRIALGLAFVISAGALTACGELPPDQAQQFVNRRLEDEILRRRNTPILVQHYNFKSTGTVDLEYVAVYHRDSQLFTFFVSRVNQSNAGKTVALRITDHEALWKGLFGLFAGELVLSSTGECLNCSSSVVVRLVNNNDDTEVLYLNPLLRTAEGGSGVNLIDTLTTFILNRL